MNVGSEEFGYTTDGSVPSSFINPHWDEFEDGVIAQYWTYLNPSNGNFNEANGNVTITDLGSNQWGDAPGLLERITGDFSVITKVYTTLSAGTQQTGIYVYQDSGNILRFHYIQTGGGSKNVAMRYRTGGLGNNLIGSATTIGDVSPLWLKLERIGNIYNSYYSLNGIDYSAVASGSTSPDLSNDVQVGIYVGAGLSADFELWEITPSIQCTGMNSTTDVQQITIEEVPFNQYHPSNNKIQVHMEDMNGNLATSGVYTVNISTDFGGPTFFNFNPNITSDITPDVTVQVQDLEDGLIIGSEQFAYSTDNSTPTGFINPHCDNLSDGTLANFWAMENKLGNIIAETNNLTIQNQQFSTAWNDDPFLYQTIDGDFTVVSQIAASLAREGNQSGISFKEGNNIIRIMYVNSSGGNIKVNLSYSTDGGASNIVIGSVTTGLVDPLWLRLTRSDSTFYGYYSTNIEYGIFEEVGNVTLAFNMNGMVGLYAGGGEHASFRDWVISPYIMVTGTNGTTTPETLTVYEVPFNQIHETNNKIRFMMSDTTGSPGISNTYTVNTTVGFYPYHPDLTLAKKDGQTQLFDYEGNVIWYYDGGGCDIEMLPDGNIMMLWPSTSPSYVRIINFTDKTTIWEYNPSGLEELDFTHDADLLPWGDILITDTTNDATHQDEVLIVDYETQNINWTYVCDEGSYPNDADYLPNGNILINLRNYDMIIEVNYTACKHLSTVTYPNYVVWSYGETGNHSLMNHQHNPDRLPNGNTIVADSDNNRIIEIDYNGTLVWMWDGNGTTTLDWPRDADVLPNGNVLIGDSRNSRLLEINKTTGEIVWEMYLGGETVAYDANRIDTIPPMAIIDSPVNSMYPTETIDITLSSDDTDVHTFWYRIYDDTNNTWVDNNIVIWNQTVQRTLSDGNYTLYAWCNDTGYREGSWDWMPFNKGNIQSGNVTVSFQINTQMTLFWSFRPNQTDDITPTVYVNVQETQYGLINGSEEFAYTRDGSDPTLFGNPHQDLFEDGNIASFWSIVNNASGIILEQAGVLNLTDNGNHEWNNGNNDAVMVYQSLVDDFTVNTEISVNKMDSTAYCGIIAYQDDLNYLTVMYHNNSEGELNVIFAITESGNTTSFISSNFPSFGVLDPLWLRLTRSGDYWTAAFSPNGDSYANYYDISNAQNINFTLKMKVGLFVANGSSVSFGDWIISPYIEVNGTGLDTEPRTIKVCEIPFRQYDELNNKIKFKINNQMNISTTSPQYTINISNFAISFRDNTIYGDSDQRIYEIDRFGNIVHSIDVSGLGVQAIADVERLSNGNFLFVDMHLTGTDSAVYEVNSSGYVVWSYKPTGANRLEWTHDADRLPNGNTLIADTSDSVSHLDRVIEINSTGDIIWAYYPGEGSYPNDVDRLSNGNTLISLRDWNKIIEVTPNGTIAWEYAPGNLSVLNHQHNSDYLPNGNIIICDSENNRIIEINSTTNEIVWMYDGNGTTTLNWPRDADLLYSGNLLITDSKNNRIIEINRTTGEIVWEIETIGFVYEADRLNSFILPLEILAPLENETWTSQTIEVVLSSPNPATDSLWYRLYDNTTSQWVDIEDQTNGKYFISSNNHWNIRQKRILSDNHSYTIYAWMNASPNMIEGGDQYTIVQSTATTTFFKINCSWIPDSNSPYPGFTLFPLDGGAGSAVREINLNGDIIWAYQAYPGSNPYDAERLPNGNTLFSNNDPKFMQDIEGGALIEVDMYGNIVWSYPEAPYCHDVDRLPNGNTVFLSENGTFEKQPGFFRGIIEVNPDKEIVWSWNIFDYYDTIPVNTHYNDIDLLDNGNFLLSLRDFDQIWEINRTGHIVWSYGSLFNHTLMYHQHNPDRLTNGNTIIADSENHRIIEINPQGQIVWMYDGNGTTTLNWPRDANRLPNGNTLIADSSNNRLLEINYQGEIVWEMTSLKGVYCADRLDMYAPYASIISPMNNTYKSNDVPLQMHCPERDLDYIIYNVLDLDNLSWVFSTNQTYYSNSILHLPNGNYTLFAWGKDTGRAPATMDDIHPNIQENPTTVTFSVDCDLIALSPQNITYDCKIFDIVVKNYTNFNQISAIFELGGNSSSVDLTWNGSFYTTTVLLTEDGQYKLSITGNDSYNDLHKYVLWFSLDRTAPIFKDLHILYNPIEIGLTQSISVTFNSIWNKKIVNISINNAPNITMSLNGTHYLYNWTPTSVNLGLNSFEIFAENLNGYKNSTVDTFIVIDSTLPQIYNVTFEDTIQLGQYQNISFSAFDIGGIKSVILELEDGSNITLTGNGYYSYTWTLTTSGNISITIFVTDNANNTGSLTFHFIVHEGGEDKQDSYWFVILIIFGVVGLSLIYRIRGRKKSARREQQMRKLPSIKESTNEEPTLEVKKPAPAEDTSSIEEVTIEKKPIPSESDALQKLSSLKKSEITDKEEDSKELDSGQEKVKDEELHKDLNE
ncbi:MAG: outer membrane protein assembly factor BamB family protein [Candidatus Helarchaeota archaeon]